MALRASCLDFEGNMNPGFLYRHHGPGPEIFKGSLLSPPSERSE